MRLFFSRAGWYCWICVLLVCSLALAEVTPHRPIRCLRDGKSQLTSMDTAVTGFRHPSGYSVDLIGVVHVGSPDYYARLNRLFRNYDAVLYEMVAESPGGRPIPVRGASPDEQSTLGMMQGGLSRLLGLDFQLDHIDYAPANFVHADVSPAEFQRSMEKRGESFMQVLLRSMQKSGADNPEAEQELAKVDLMSLVSGTPSPRDRTHLRRAMALMFSKPEKMIEVLEGPGGGTLLAVRNQKALSVLRGQVGKGRRRLAIFYGAAHMLDMEKRLVKDFGMRYQRQTWVPAWDLRMPDSGGATPK